jgi:hypothetical protein
MDNSIVIRQFERSQFRTRRREIPVKDASNPQAFRDLDEHRGVFDEHDLAGYPISFAPECGLTLRPDGGSNSLNT